VYFKQLTRTTSDDVSPERPPKGRGLWVSTSEELVEYWERKLLSVNTKFLERLD
jgi:hypothetical protein